jgi:hypothetical protein
MARRLPAPALAAIALLAAPGAFAQSVIKRPGVHPQYVLEAEPHGLVGPFPDFFPGIGVRGTVELLDPGFVTSINDTIGIGFGADYAKRVVVPIVLQWNFYLHRNWSVFGEPGLAVAEKFRPFVMYAGGRWHFHDAMSLTLRVGHPTLSVGVSFFL